MRPAAALLALLVLLPAVTSAAPPSAYEEEGTLAPGTVALGGLQTYAVWLEVGQRVEIVVATPEEGPSVDAILRELCGVSPSPTACGSFAITGPDSAAGGECGLAHAQGAGTLTLSHVAVRAGQHFLGLRPVASADAIPYLVTLTVDGEAPGAVGRGGADLVLGEDATPCALRTAAGLS